MKKKLVILTTHFGTNFSGGSTATCEIFSRIEHHFEKIIVVGTELGDHPFESIEFLKYKNWIHAFKVLKSLRTDSTIFYGDFYNSFLLVLAKVKFHFTYHDNWPELGKEGALNALRSLFYTNVYNNIFKRAEVVVTVSQFKLNYVEKYTDKAQLIYNGFNTHNSALDSPTSKKNIIMVGNIDKRKYGMALRLFKQLSLNDSVTVDIYGNITDSKLACQMDEFPFVSIKGFKKLIPYHSYKCLLHTSIMENLPIVFCEAFHNNVPVLAFDVGGTKEIVNENNGVLIPPYDLSLMQSELRSMLSGSRNIETNHKTLEQFSWIAASERYLELLVA